MVVVIDSSAPGRVARFRPAWRKCMTMTIRPTSTIGFIGLQETNTIGYYTDYWGAYTRHLDPEVHSPGKRNTQKIERKHLTLRTRIKRLVPLQTLIAHIGFQCLT